MAGPTTITSRAAPAGNVRVLLIDRDEPMRRVMRSLLREAGCQVDAAASSGEGLRHLVRQDFDVVVFDASAETVGGVQFIRETRDLWPWLGFVITTSHHGEAAQEHARQGGLRILHKPVDARELRESVMEEARGKRRRQEETAGRSLDRLHKQLEVLRRFGEQAVSAENIEKGMATLSSGIGQMFPCSAVGLMQHDADEHLIHVNVLKPVAQPFITALEEAMLARFEMLTDHPRPQDVVRIHTDTAPVLPDAPAQMTRMLCLPVMNNEGPRGLLALAVGADDEDGVRDPVFLHHVASQLSTIMTALHRMRQLAVRDAMTGVYNRKGLEDEYERTWQMSRRFNIPLGVAIIDIDYFKQINDNHGHAVGDQVIKEFAGITLNVARGTDIVARYGGDELVVILPHSAAGDVIAFGERLLDAVRHHIFCEGGQNIQTTASIGVASSLPADTDDTAAGLMARADQALYRAKKAGRDRAALQQRGDATPAVVVTGPVLDPAHRAPELRPVESKGRILVVDDEPGVALLFARILKKQGYEVNVDHSAVAAIQRLKNEAATPYNILLTDLSMPDKSGLELLDELRSVNEDLIKIVVTGNATLDSAVTSLRRGAYDFVEKPVVSDQLIAVVGRAMEYGRLKSENLRYQLHLEDLVREKSAALREALDNIRASYDFTLEAMVQLLDARERSTSKHSLRVRGLALILARQMNLSENEIEEISKGALLHDIGKIAIPDSILLKPGKLTDEEREVMKSHAEIGYRILKASAYLSKSAEIVFSHHEMFNGSGYPRKLKGGQIPIGARIFTIADTYDAMRSNRVYRKSVPPQEVIEEIKAHAGTQFDPAVVEAFLRCQPAFEQAGNWDAEQGHVHAPSEAR